MSRLPKVTIYTDGACSGNPGPGGWGAVLIYGDVTKEIFGSEIDTTNNKMELLAAIQALQLLKKTCQVELFTDSIYVQKGITEWIESWLKKNWRKSDNALVKNADLWQKLYELSKLHSINWRWVKGHDINPGNIKADALAVKGRKIAELAVKAQQNI